MEINKLKILYDAIRSVEEPSIENPTKEDVKSMLNFAVHYMDNGLDGVLEAMETYAEERASYLFRKTSFANET